MILVTMMKTQAVLCKLVTPAPLFSCVCILTISMCRVVVCLISWLLFYCLFRYLGHIPHGFYEAQMRGFFSQFGGVKRLRLARSKKSGRSKHYAFIQFEVRCQYRAARLACWWPVTNSTVLLLLHCTACSGRG